MAKILAMSPTLLDTYLTCPRQYMAKYVTKEVVFQQNEAAAYGDRIHKSVEAALRDGAALTPEAAYMQPLVDWCFQQRAKPGVDMFVEQTLSINRDLNPCDKWDKGKYMWGKADVLFVDHNTGTNIIVDWKTGKPRDAHTQSRILSLCATKSTGYVKNLCMWVHCRHNNLHKDMIVLNDLLPLNVLFEDAKRYETACVNDEFPPIRNFLCANYCDVLSCQHNGKR